MDISSETGDSRSATLMLHLLGRCNLTCLHCYMEGSPLRREQLPLEWVLRSVAECEPLGIGALYLTGGEPLLYPSLRRVLESTASTSGLKVTVCTNGTLITSDWAALLRETGAQVNISIDGDAEFHDHFRNLHGSFRAAERGVRILVQAGIPVTIISTISRRNRHCLASLAAWAAK